MPTLLGVAPALTQLPPYEVFSAKVDLVARYDNPYDYDEVAVEVRLEGPAGAAYSVDGFYQAAPRVDPATGIVGPRQAAGFYFRFTPDRTGTWRYTARVTDQDGSSDPVAGSFECRGAPKGRGFVRRVSGNYLQCDNGDAFIPIGENLAWPQGDPFVSYRNWLTELTESGGNYLRLWHAHWGLGIEWKKDGQTFDGLRRYAPANMAYLDWLFDHCAERDVRILLALQHHGPVSTKVDPNWADSPYNLINGGPCRHPWEFFTEATAKAHTRNRLRYCVARWGHSPALLAWELFNEVDWTDDYSKHREDISDWHLDMAAFLKEIDPYGHLVTTSFAKAKHEPVVWTCPNIDFTQVHHYQHNDNPERALAARTQQQIADYGKPTLAAEFGLGGSLDLDTLDPEGIHLHNALWAGLFSGGLGTAMSWWWDTYVHPRQLFRHFAAIRAVSDRIPFITANLRPAKLFFTGAPAALDGYGLIAENGRSAAGWMLNHRYHHRQLASGREPEPVVGAELRLPGFAEGDFTVSWYDCQSGALVAQAPVASLEGVLSIPVPPVRWDMAFLVDEQSIVV